MAAKTKVHDFFSETSAHGFSKISSSQGPRRLLWVLLTLAALAGFTYHLSELTKNYLRYKKSVFNDIVKNSFQFPDVTFCPTHGFSAVKLRKFENQGVMNNIKKFWGLANALQKRGNESDSALVRGSLKTMAYKYDLFKRPQDHIVNCLFKDEACDFRNFTMFKHNTRLICFRFAPKNRSLAQKGSKDGLRLVLNTYGSVRFDKLRDEDLLNTVDGYKIHIHAAGIRASFTSGQILAEKSSLLNVGLNMIRVQNLDTPLDPCEDKSRKWTILTDLNSGPHFDPVTFHNRTDIDCSRIKEQSAMVERCGCLDENSIIEKSKVGNFGHCHYIDHDLLSNMANTTTIEELSKTQIERFIQISNFSRCHAREFRKIRYGLHNSKCEMDNCISVSYSTSTQATNWPADSEKNITNALLIKKLRKVIKLANEKGEPLDPSTLDYAFRNITYVEGLEGVRNYDKFPFIAINIYANSLATMTETEVLSVTFSEFIASIGGIMGLWSGFSAITLCEFADFFISIVGYWCCRFRSGRLNKKKEEIEASQS